MPTPGEEPKISARESHPKGRRARTLVAIGLVLWIWLSFVISVQLGFVHSWLQEFMALDETHHVLVHAVWVGPRLDGLGFSASMLSGSAPGDLAVVIDPASLECFQGRYSQRPRGKPLGPLSQELVAEQLASGLPTVPREKIDPLATDILNVLTGVRERGLDAMTFRDFDQGGGIAEGRLHAVNAYGGPGEAVGFRFRRIFIVWIALSTIGVLLAAALRRRSTRRPPVDSQEDRAHASA